MTSTIQNFKDDARRWGWPKALGVRLLGRLQILLGLHVLVARQTSRSSRPNQSIPPPGIRFAELDESLALRLTRARELDISATFIRDAMKRGDRIFGAFAGEQLVTYLWRSFSDTPYMGNVWVHVEQPFSYSYKAFTLPEFRGQHILPALAAHAQSVYAAEGYEVPYSLVAIDNFASLSIAKHHPTKIVGYCGFLHIFGHDFTFHSKAVKNSALTLYVRKS